MNENETLNEGAALPAVPSRLGCDLIKAERERQISQEGWSEEHDEKHDQGELLEAATAYIQLAAARVNHTGYIYDSRPPNAWPWGAEWWKPCSEIRALTKAGALIAAEIDRLNAVERKRSKHPNGRGEPPLTATKGIE